MPTNALEHKVSVSSFYTEEELPTLGLASYGRDVRISRYARLYSPAHIRIGDNVRIDDFCILSGHITLGSHIHIAAYCALYGAMGIVLEDYTGLSARTTLYSAMDDFGGDYLIGPIHDSSLTHVTGGEVRLCRYAQVGAGSTVFPAVTMAEGSVLGAMSLCKVSTEPWIIYAGIPCRAIKPRNKGLLTRIFGNTQHDITFSGNIATSIENEAFLTAPPHYSQIISILFLQSFDFAA